MAVEGETSAHRHPEAPSNPATTPTWHLRRGARTTNVARAPRFRLLPPAIAVAHTASQPWACKSVQRA
jgi:hypothetical protein